MESDDAWLTEDMKICGGSSAANGYLLNARTSENLPICAFHYGILVELQNKNPQFFVRNKLSLRSGYVEADFVEKEKEIESENEINN